MQQTISQKNLYKKFDSLVEIPFIFIKKIMEKNLRFLLLVTLSFIVQASFAQVTLISNNTNINGGLVLSNGRPVMLSDAGFLYTTNGTTASVITTSVFYNDSSSASIYKGELYFSGVNTSGDQELWATDGTSGGTRLVKNINASGSSEPDNFFIFNNTFYFTADDGVHGEELWSSDGTTGNTKMVTDINGTATGSIADDVSFFINGGNVFFTATNASAVLGLYKLTTSGVSLVKNNFGSDINLNTALYCTALGNKTIFTVDKGSFGTGSAQLWITDGTTANTTLLYDFGAGTFGLLFPELILFKGKVLFDGVDATHGEELWSTDGTPANTKLLKDINPGTDNSYPVIGFGVTLNNKLFFTAITNGAGDELWSTDGTAANTVMVKDINPGTDDASPQLLFNEGAIQSIIASGNFTNINYQQFFTPFKGKIYFTATDGMHGNELWSTDGTAANTTMVKDINPGANNGVDAGTSSFFTTTGIYFSATNGTNGYEPWVTDGTSTGTTQVYDINPGSDSSNPSYQFIYNNQLYLTAQNSGTDTDLYKINMPLTVLPVNITTFIASLQTESVLLNWTTATEVNTDHFGIERSVDGAHFENVGNVSATGNSSSAQNYQYNDYNALHIGSSVLYYRLKTIDRDGKYTYSSILKVQLRGSGFTYTLSPNPVRNQLTVSFSTSNTNKAVLKITDGNGKAVYEKSMQSLQAGSVQQNINVAGFASGIYYVQIITDSGTKTLRFVKQ